MITGDGIVSPSQTQRLHTALHTALRAAGVDSSRYVIQGATHGDVAVLLGNPDEVLPWYTEEVVGLSVDFFHKNLG